MKKTILIISLLASFQLAKSQTYGSMGSYNSLGVPNYLTATNDVIPSALLSSIAASLPENFPVPIYHPNYISTGTTTNIYMQAAGDVWVTFVDEGAGYKNVLGYYSYPVTNPPLVAPSNSNLKVIFPNVSKVNSGGGLVPGNKVHLGHFNAGTVISWFLIADGFRNNAVTNGNWKLFSNYQFNPEANASLRYHNVLLYDTVFKKIILGFEDIRRDYSSCDNDFNDAIFYVTATPDTAISLAGINIATNPTPQVSTGNSGGLESNGSLSALISKRNFERQKQLNPVNQQTQLATSKISSKNTRNNLQQFLPDLGAIGLSSYISTPTDLLGITNAVDLLSYDYYDTLNTRQAAVLLTKTENKVYNHTKSICDRLKNASLLKIEEKAFDGINFITYTLKQEEGEIEYVTCFSVSNEQDSYKLYNQWLISQYPSKSEYLNFQIWSSLPHLNQYLVSRTISQIATIKPMLVDSSIKNCPTIYFKHGKLEQNHLMLEINNPQAELNGSIMLNYTLTEQDERKELVFPITLKANQLNTFSIPFDGLFDADISLKINDEIVDEMYLADGAWGLDYPTSTTTIHDYTIETNETNANIDEYSIARKTNVHADFKEYLTLFKQFRPSNLPVDLNHYEYVNLSIKTNQTTWLKLNKKSISNWNEQAKIAIYPTNDSISHVSIPVSLFKNNKGESISLDDILSISFTQFANQSNATSDLAVQNLSFSKEPKNALFQSVSSTIAYPNPIKSGEILSIDFLNEIDNEINIQLIDIFGKTIISNNLKTAPGLMKESLKLPEQIANGNYILQLKGSKKTERIRVSIYK